MPEVDDVDLPMLFCLMDEIGETPPQDFLANAEIKARIRKSEQEKKSSLQSFEMERGKVRRRNHGD
jgi:hypothetical protein